MKVQFSVPRHAEIWLGLLVGTATGALTVATGIFVMPGTPYCNRCNSTATGWCRRWACRSRSRPSPSRPRSAMPAKCRRRLPGLSLLALGAALAGMVLGQVVRGKVKAETFRLCFFLGLLLLGAHLALR